jgi:hypothetical protein
MSSAKYLFYQPGVEGRVALLGSEIRPAKLSRRFCFVIKFVNRKKKAYVKYLLKLKTNLQFTTNCIGPKWMKPRSFPNQLDLFTPLEINTLKKSKTNVQD